eukprot:TRINITY_DN26920_c0_g1_i1.p1 TRINITY_DN26920_c0_g1~~TRINITY_DN26920_c0_g1_i1.p1  ORF type:complete len:348 (+),score=45.23 TRINITY_DN26920_c0_g1_i1:46-1044(+)
MWTFQLGRAARRFGPVLGPAFAAVSCPQIAGCEPVRPPTLSPLHHRIQSLQESFQAKSPGAIAAKFGDKPHVVRVVLTGGPCGGKSSCLDHIKNEATRSGFNVISCPEIATVIFNSGYTFDPSNKLTFQTAVASLQLQLERQMITLAESTGVPTILVVDRGMMDNKAFLSKDEWQKVISELKQRMPSDHGKVIDEDYLLNRYDVVIHLTTTAELDPDGDPLRDSKGNLIYRYGRTTDDSGHVVIRHEKPQAARAQDDRIREVWARHKRHHVVRNRGTFEDKIRDAVDIVMEVAEELHPQKLDNKTLRRRIRELSRQVERLEAAQAISKGRSV